jgi:hypothetical protein
VTILAKIASFSGQKTANFISKPAISSQKELKNTHFPIKNSHFPIKNTHFPIKNAIFPIKNPSFTRFDPPPKEIVEFPCATRDPHQLLWEK